MMNTRLLQRVLKLQQM